MVFWKSSLPWFSPSKLTKASPSSSEGKFMEGDTYHLLQRFFTHFSPLCRGDTMSQKMPSKVTQWSHHYNFIWYLDSQKKKVSEFLKVLHSIENWMDEKIVEKEDYILCHFLDFYQNMKKLLENNPIFVLLIQCTISENTIAGTHKKIHHY